MGHLQKPLLPASLPYDASSLFERFIGLCRNVFFAIDDYSDIDFIIAMSGLYYLFTESFYASGTGSSGAQNNGYGPLCRRALKTALWAAGAFLPPRMDSVQALILGVSDGLYLDIFLLISIGSRHMPSKCRNLG